MSWQIFHTECMALSGMQHVSRVQYAQVMSLAYHNCVLRHFESMTAAGTVVNTAPKVPMLFNGFLAMCEMNLTQHNMVNWIQQIGVYVQEYWVGALITGSTGFVNVSDVGIWIAPPVIQNYDFNIILWYFEAVARIHIMTLRGTYTSTVLTGVTSPWSGALLNAMG